MTKSTDDHKRETSRWVGKILRICESVSFCKVTIISIQTTVVIIGGALALVVVVGPEVMTKLGYAYMALNAVGGAVITILCTNRLAGVVDRAIVTQSAPVSPETPEKSEEFTT